MNGGIDQTVDDGDTGLVYNQYKIGLRTEPCGTPTTFSSCLSDSVNVYSL